MFSLVSTCRYTPSFTPWGSPRGGPKKPHHAMELMRPRRRATRPPRPPSPALFRAQLDDGRAGWTTAEEPLPGQPAVARQGRVTSSPPQLVPGEVAPGPGPQKVHSKLQMRASALSSPGPRASAQRSQIGRISSTSGRHHVRPRPRSATISSRTWRTATMAGWLRRWSSYRPAAPDGTPAVDLLDRGGGGQVNEAGTSDALAGADQVEGGRVVVHLVDQVRLNPASAGGHHATTAAHPRR